MNIITNKYTWQPQQIKFPGRSKTRPFKFVKGEDDPTAFLPLYTRIDGQVKLIQVTINI